MGGEQTRPQGAMQLPRNASISLQNRAEQSSELSQCHSCPYFSLGSRLGGLTCGLYSRWKILSCLLHKDGMTALIIFKSEVKSSRRYGGWFQSWWWFCVSLAKKICTSLSSGLNMKQNVYISSCMFPLWAEATWLFPILSLISVHPSPPRLKMPPMDKVTYFSHGYTLDRRFKQSEHLTLFPFHFNCMKYLTKCPYSW